MDVVKRVVVNTFAQYMRTVINICLSLYSTRLVLDALGQSDYGIYMLIGGVVAMLGFITNAMVVTTQRHLSFAYGRGVQEEVQSVFANSLFLHIVIGVLIVVLLSVLSPLLFTHFLNIDEARVGVAWKVYFIMLLSLLITFLTSPFRSLLIAHENIVYISLIDVIDGVLKVLLAIWLYHVSSDKLIVYAVYMLSIMAFNLIALSLFSNLRYKECCFVPKLKQLNTSVQKKIAGFAGWTTYSIACILTRNQGVAVVLNHFFGTVINSAYGIAMQVSGSTLFLSESVMNALRPQIIKAEGEGNRHKMLNKTEIACKFSFLLFFVIALPLILEMPAILQVWLSKVPPHAVFFCRLILVSSVFDQLTTGLGVANQAIGRIRNYSLVINTLKMLTLPIIWLFLHNGFDMEFALLFYVLIELTCALIRIPFLKYQANLSVYHFIKNVFIKESYVVLLLLVVCSVFVSQIHFPFRFIFTIILSFIVGIVSIFLMACNDEERQLLLILFKLENIYLNVKHQAVKLLFSSWAHLSMKSYVSYLYKKRRGHSMNWQNPQDLNEKINWLKFNSDTRIWSRLSDKFLVRQYVAEKGLADLVVPLYGKWNSVNEIVWQQLPSQFVMKTTNGSGDVKICFDKSQIQFLEWEKHFNHYLKYRLGYAMGEPHYNLIQPSIIAEQLLDISNQSLYSSSLIDYKVWTINGEPICVWVVTNRTHEHAEMMLYDLHWAPHPEYLQEKDPHFSISTSILPPPPHLARMIEAAKILATGFPQVRIDFYDCGQLRFGEMTFTSAGGYMNYFTDEFLLKLGQRLVLPHT